jgi:hypothetical protein
MEFGSSNGEGVAQVHGTPSIRLAGGHLTSGWLMPEGAPVPGIGAWADVLRADNDARIGKLALPHTIEFPVPTRRISASAPARSP